MTRRDFTSATQPPPSTARVSRVRPRFIVQKHPRPGAGWCSICSADDRHRRGVLVFDGADEMHGFQWLCWSCSSRIHAAWRGKDEG